MGANGGYVRDVRADVRALADLQTKQAQVHQLQQRSKRNCMNFGCIDASKWSECVRACVNTAWMVVCSRVVPPPDDAHTTWRLRRSRMK